MKAGRNESALRAASGADGLSVWEGFGKLPFLVRVSDHCQGMRQHVVLSVIVSHDEMLDQSYQCTRLLNHMCVVASE